MSRAADLGRARTHTSALVALLRAGAPLSQVREDLIRTNLVLVAFLARSVRRNTVDSIADLEQVGSVGLIKAVDRFDPDRGVEFSTYATPLILGEIQHYLRDSACWSLRGVETSPVPPDELDERAGPGLVGPEPGYAAVEGALDASALVLQLPPDQREVISLCLLAGLSQREVADRVGASQATVSRLMQSGLARLRALVAA